MVVVVESDQILQAQVTGHRGSLRSHTLLHTSITKEDVCAVVEQLKAIPVECRCGIRLSHSETDSIRESLSKGTGGHLNTVRVVGFRMARRKRVKLTESLEVIHREFVAHQMQHNVQQGTCMTIGKHEAIPVNPSRVFRVGRHHPAPQQVSQRRKTHGSARVSRLGVCYNIS